MSTKIEDLSALSYTSKDFGSIYPEMLDLAKQLTNKWDPSQSNESDPGVVLLKEGAFVADHNNYNIDKNILEAFLPSATQDRSVRNITEMNGYTPRYYVSATGDVTFSWTQPESEKELDTLFTIPAFTIVVSDADETVSYTQVEDLAIGETSSSCLFMEGTLQTLSINDLSVITVDNIDDNNRLYLPETMVAQNGVYIKNVNENDYDGYWIRNNYLMTQPLGSRIYKLDYDSFRDLPYIEFPTDISNLIGDGLQIQYIATSGVSGNVSARSLSKILSPAKFTDAEGNERSTETLTVWNSASITNGKDPETIDEMYQSFRRVVGTFDTLVTCQDYSNCVYNLTDDYDNPYVSNVYVTDRRSDYNHAANVISFDLNTLSVRLKNISTDNCALNFKGEATSNNQLPSTANPGDMYYVTNYETSEVSLEDGLYINVSTYGDANFVKTEIINLNDFSILTQAMTPYDLIIYGLKVFSLGEYSKVNYWQALENSFTPITPAIREELEDFELEELKCLSHTFRDPETNDIYCFKNLAPLDLIISTYNKITSEQKAEILNNIYQALSVRFNPRNIDFGEKLSETDIANTVKNSDDRIRDVEWRSPLRYETYASLTNGSNKKLNSDEGSAYLIELIAKNVLAGRVCLFSFYDDFNFEYGQKDGKLYPNVNKLETELWIPLVATDDTSNSAINSSDSLNRVNSYEINSTGSNFLYTLKTLSPVIIRPEDSEGAGSYSLREDEEFILYEVTGEGNEQKIVRTTNYAPTVNVSVDILNGTSSNITSEGSKNQLNAGNVVITITETIQSSPSDTVNLDYTLNKNEIIQIIHPNYYSDKTYQTYVNYRYESINNNRIYANTEYTLAAGESMIFIYSQDGEQKEDRLSPGSVVSSSFDIVPTDLLPTTVIKSVGGVNKAFKQLTANQTISSRKLLQTKLSSSDIWCYWMINSADSGENTLFEPDETYKILRNNEYFIYTNSNLNELVILGAGTRISRDSSGADSKWTIPDNEITIESITENGTASNVSWQKTLGLQTDPLYITEMNIITLGEGNHIKITGWSNDKMPVDSDNLYAFNGDDYYVCDGSITYTINGESVVLPSIDNFYLIKSRLDINVGSGMAQELLYSATEPESSEDEIIYNSIQRIKAYYNDVQVGETIDARNYSYVQASKLISAIGNTINLSELCDLYVYSKDDVVYPGSIKIGKTGNQKSQVYKFFAIKPRSNMYMIPIHVTDDEVPINISGKFNVSGSSTEPDLTLYDYSNYNKTGGTINYGDPITVLGGGSSYYIIFNAQGYGENDDITVTITLSWIENAVRTNELIIVDNICCINGANTELGISSIEDVMLEINKLITNSDKPSTKVYYPYKLDNSIAMDTINFKDAFCMWDKNNIANIMTIPQIDLKNSTIDVRARNMGD